MADRPTTGDREQQRRDNVASRRQSGLEPLPRDREDAQADQSRSDGDGPGHADRDREADRE